MDLHGRITFILSTAFSLGLGTGESNIGQKENSSTRNLHSPFFHIEDYVNQKRHLNPTEENHRVKITGYRSHGSPRSSVVSPQVDSGKNQAKRTRISMNLGSNHPNLTKENEGIKLKDRKVTSRIIGGHGAADGMFGSLVTLKNRKKQHGCGGTILRKDVVLTAAHCCQRHAETGLGIEWAQAGGIHLNKMRQNRKIVKFVRHPKYKLQKKKDEPPGGHDLCLLKVVPNFKVENKTNIKVNFAKRNDKEVLKNDSLIVAGYGRQNRQGGEILNDNELKYLPILAINDTECRNRLKHIFEKAKIVSEDYSGYVIKENLCTIQPTRGTDACQGDSGGPLYLAEGKERGPWDTLAGVVSWGPGCAIKDAPAIYVDVLDYAKWIDETMKTL